LESFRAAVNSQAAQLELKIAPPRQTDLDAAYARLRQAQADLARAAADYRDTLLTAPVDGLVTKVHLKVGEFTPTGAAITMLGSDPYRIEMFVSEIDIPKVQLSQSGSIELDAFRGTHFALRVSEIDPAATDKDGVSKYRVKLDFVYPHEELKIGMTGDTEIQTGLRSDVVSVPLRSVIVQEDGTKIVRVLDDDGKIEERTVKTGMEGVGGETEVTGVGSGETVVVLEKK
jgi:HlyD family secretion protein